MCHRIGLSPIRTIGFGMNSVSSFNRVPRPPQKMTTGISPVDRFLDVCFIFKGVYEHIHQKTPSRQWRGNERKCRRYLMSAKRNSATARALTNDERSEERRVGKEGRSRWAP